MIYKQCIVLVKTYYIKNNKNKIKQLNLSLTINL